MTTTKIPVRTVFDNLGNPIGLSEFQIGEVVAIAQGGTSANTVADARINLGVSDSNIRSLFSTSGDLSYDSSTGVFSFTNDPGDIESVTAGNGLTGGGTSGDVTLDVGGGYGITVNSNNIEVNNSDITALVTKSLVDNLGVDAATLDGIDSSAFALDTDLTTANVAEVTNLYYTNARVSSFLTPSLTTANVAEVSNLYFTESRSRNSVSASGSISYDNSTGVFSFTQGNSDTVNEGSTNLYFTNARAVAALVDQAVTMGQATITGNLIVLGNVVEFNTETLIIEDKNIVLANGSPSAAASNGSGITVDGSNAKLTYFSEDDKWEFNKDLSVEGSIAATGNITSPFFYSESDLTLKENVNPIQDALNKVVSLIGVDFVWKSTKQKSIGVVAQNVEQIVPEIVGKSSSGFKTVQYDSLIPLLIEAIKEQQKQIDDLRSKLK